MSLPQVPPNREDRPRRTHFVYVATENSKTWHGWIAGPCHWFDCHTKGRTTPCVDIMTAGEVRCERCEAGHEVEECGYQPLYRETDAKPVMVIVHGYTREVVDRHKLHARVCMGRGAAKSDGVYVIAALNPLPRYTSTLVERLKPADLTETLLRVWKLPDLVEWYRQTHGAAVAPPPKPAAAPLPKHKKPPVKNDGTFFSAAYDAAARRAEAAGEAPTVAEAIEIVGGRLKAALEPSKNGHHKSE